MRKWLQFGPGCRVRIGTWILVLYREQKVLRRKRRVA